MGRVVGVTVTTQATPPELPTPVLPAPELPSPLLPHPELPVPLFPVPEFPVPLLPVPELPVPVFPFPELPTPTLLHPESEMLALVPQLIGCLTSADGAGERCSAETRARLATSAVMATDGS
jgi:E3 ubiquitin-protein ligase RFWD3